MKKIVAVTLLLTLCLTLAVSCNRKEDGTMSGVYTYGGETYAFTLGGVVIYSADGARFSAYSADGGSITVGDTEISENELTAGTLASPGDALDTSFFVLSSVGGVQTITALTEQGKAQTALVIPTTVGDIAEGAFEGSSVKAIVIPDGSALNLSNGSLKNGGSLAVLVSGSVAPGTDLTCGAELLSGTSGVTFYIEKSALSTYKTHYSWGAFKDNMTGI